MYVTQFTLFKVKKKGLLSPFLTGSRPVSAQLIPAVLTRQPESPALEQGYVHTHAAGACAVLGFKLRNGHADFAAGHFNN